MEKFKTMLKEHVMIIFALLLVALIIIIGIFFIYRNQVEKTNTTQSEVTRLEREVTTKNGEITILTQTKEDLIEQIAQVAVDYDAKIETLNGTIKTLDSQLKVSFTLQDYVVDSLAKHGYKEPKLMLETLTEHNDLIPVEGVLGGTMAWWPEYSVVLNEKYVFGYFEDGHILGYALLEYAFDQDDNLTWKLIDSYID